MPGLHIDFVGGGGSAFYNDPKNFIFLNFVELNELMNNGGLEPERKYVLTDYLHRYAINGSNSDGIVYYLQTYDYLYGYATFGYYVYDLPTGKEVIVTGLPEGYAGPVQIGDTTTVSENSQNYYFRFANGMHSIIGIEFKIYQSRFNTIEEGSEILDANGRPVMVPGGIINTDVHDGAPYMDMTAEENLAVVPEQLIFTAETAHAFKKDVESFTFVGDIVTYDFNAVEIVNDNYEVIGTRKGFIKSRRNDSLGIDLPLDWRNSRFRRWCLNLDSRTKLLNQHLDVAATKLGSQGQWLYTAGIRSINEPQYFYVAKTVEGFLPNLDANAQKATFAYTVETPVAAKDYPVFPLDENRDPDKERVAAVKLKSLFDTVFQCLPGESNSPVIVEAESFSNSTFVSSVSMRDPELQVRNHVAIDAILYEGTKGQFLDCVNLSYLQVTRSNEFILEGIVFASMQDGVRLAGVDQPLPVVWWIYLYINNSVFINGAVSGVTPMWYLDNTRLIETSLFAYYSPTNPNTPNDSKYQREVIKIQSGVFSKVTMRFLNIVDRVLLDNLLFRDSNAAAGNGLSFYDFTAALYSKVLKLNPENYQMYYENAGNVVSYSINSEPSETPIYNGILRVKDVVLVAANWVLNEVTGFYEYTYNNENILILREVEIVPHNESLDTVISAAISPFLTILDGAVKIYAEFAPVEDIMVNLLIQQAQDV